MCRLLPRVDLPASEEIGNGMARMFLASRTAADIPAELIFKMFLQSRGQKGSAASFEKKIRILREETRNGLFGFDLNEFDRYVQDYRAAGFPSVRHSADYRQAYAPAYRLIDSRLARILPLIAAIVRKLSEKQTVIVAIDGKAASGKTTAAGLLQALFPANIIHADDFFLPAGLRTQERLGQIGGNFHVERFAEEVAVPLQKGIPFSFRPYDCAIDGLKEPVILVPKALTVVEGAYCMHRDLPDIYDLKVYFHIDAARQKRRIKKRNSPDAYERFLTQWVPMENRYLKGHDVKKRCGLHL
jgi:uridine kinase